MDVWTCQVFVPQWMEASANRPVRSILFQPVISMLLDCTRKRTRREGLALEIARLKDLVEIRPFVAVLAGNSSGLAAGREGPPGSIHDGWLSMTDVVIGEEPVFLESGGEKYSVGGCRWFFGGVGRGEK